MSQYDDGIDFDSLVWDEQEEALSEYFQRCGLGKKLSDALAEIVNDSPNELKQREIHNEIEWDGLLEEICAKRSEREREEKAEQRWNDRHKR